MKFFNNERILNGKNSKFEKLIKSDLKQLKLPPPQSQIAIAQLSHITYDSVSGELQKLEEKREQVRLNNPQILTQDFNVCFQILFNAF